MTQKDKLKQEQQDELEKLCSKHKVDADKMMNLVKNEKDKRLLRKRLNIQKIIEKTITEEAGV